MPRKRFSCWKRCYWKTFRLINGKKAQSLIVSHLKVSDRFLQPIAFTTHGHKTSKKWHFFRGTDKIMHVFCFHRWKWRFSSNSSMKLVKNQKHSMILMKIFIFIGESKIHAGLCPFHDRKWHVFDGFGVKYMNFFDVCPWVGHLFLCSVRTVSR